MINKIEHSPTFTLKELAGRSPAFGLDDDSVELTELDLEVFRAFIRAWPAGLTLENGEYYETFRHYRAGQALSSRCKNKTATDAAMLKRDVEPS